MRVLVLGASGIVGTTMRLCVPPGVDPVWYRRTPDPITLGFDLEQTDKLEPFLDALRPDCIVNLAGESSPDAVERAPRGYYTINVVVPRLLAQWCQTHHGHHAKFIQISSQSVFDGEHPPYSPDSVTNPINQYGKQKEQAENDTLEFGGVVVRLTFILGIRPMPHTGRRNPLEAMLDGSQPNQVFDRYFSPLFAKDAAEGIWDAVLHAQPNKGEIRHLGIPEAWSRYSIAEAVGAELGRELERRDFNGITSVTPPCIWPGIVPVRHDSFDGLAPRPRWTTYAQTNSRTSVEAGIAKCVLDYRSELVSRAREIALFLGLSEHEAVARLSLGFGDLHAAVTEDFNRAVKLEKVEEVLPLYLHPAFAHGYYDHDFKWQPPPGTVIRSHRAPETEVELLDWYRTTRAYIWELSAYHIDTAIFDYPAMCEGIADTLLVAKIRTVLCLGDGIGDLTLALRRAGLDATYHDLSGSQTARYAAFRYWNQTGQELPTLFCSNGDSYLGEAEQFGAVCSLDFLEHTLDVESFVKSIYRVLKPGGYLVAQNAFGIGSEPGGSMPMHQKCNDKWAQAVEGDAGTAQWDALLTSVGFKQLRSQWYVKL